MLSSCALPVLQRHELACAPPDGASRSFWSAQVACARKAVRAGHGGSQDALARTLFAAYNRGFDSSYLPEALPLFRDIQGRASGDACTTEAIDFGRVLYAEYRRTGQINPIQEMVAFHEQMATRGVRGVALDCQHAKALLARGALTGSQPDVSRAKEILDGAALRVDESTSSDWMVTSALYHDIVWRMESQYDLKALGSLKDNLSKQMMLDGMMRPPPDVLVAYTSICSILCTAGVDLSDAVTFLEPTLGVRGQPAPDAFGSLCSLSHLYINICFVRRDVVYVTKARECIDQMFSYAQENAIDRSEAHHALGRCLFTMYWQFRRQDLNLFDDTATQWRAALGCCPPHHVYRHRYLIGLTISLTMIFEHTGSVGALNEGIALAEPHWGMASINAPLAINVAELLIRRARAGRLRSTTKRRLLQRAVDVLQAVLAHTPPGSLYRAAVFRQFSLVYTACRNAGLPVDAAEHVAAARSGVASASSEIIHSQMSSRVVLAKVLLEVSRDTQDSAPLDECMALVKWINERLDSYLDEADNRFDTDIAWLQAHCHLLRYQLSGVGADIELAKKAFEVYASDLADKIVNRVRGCLDWADATRLAAEPALEMRAYRQAVALLPQLAFVGGDLSTMFEALQLVEGVSARAAVLALDMGDVLGAVELLEETRGVVWSQSLQLRASAEDVPPQHAKDFARTLDQLKTAGSAVERRRHAKDLEDRIEQIRQVDGFDRFLLPRRYAELRACASCGTVVLVIPSDTATDVILIPSREADPIHLRLHALKAVRLQKLVARLKNTNDRSRDTASVDAGHQRKMKKVEVVDSQRALIKPEDEHVQVLKELWSALVYPVLSQLGLQVTFVWGRSPYQRR
jgi:hypothetical protein